jgi:hypothetical protein
MCLRGASEVDKGALAKHAEARLGAYVVWEPMRGAREAAVAAATTTVSDPRATHYWDEGGRLMQDFSSVLGLRGPAWDVYLLYGPEARWDDARPPAPAFFMHQLESADPRLELDASVFDAKLGELLSRAPAAAVGGPTTR